MNSTPSWSSAPQSVTDWGFVRDGDLRTIHAPIDFLGVNYYNPHRGRCPRDRRRLGMARSGRRVGGARGPAADRHGLAGAARQPSPSCCVDLHADYPGTTFVVTENGAAYPDRANADGGVDDPERVAYVRGHVAAVLDAIDAGVDVRGYFLWSLLDNFEWGWGLAQRFGIVHVDFDTLARTPKASALAYRQIIADHGV